MTSTQLTTTKNGLTFKRWHYTGRPSIGERRNGRTTDGANAANAFTR